MCRGAQARLTSRPSALSRLPPPYGEGLGGEKWPYRHRPDEPKMLNLIPAHGEPSLLAGRAYRLGGMECFAR